METEGTDKKFYHFSEIIPVYDNLVASNTAKAYFTFFYKKLTQVVFLNTPDMTSSLYKSILKHCL